MAFWAAPGANGGPGGSFVGSVIKPSRDRLRVRSGPFTGLNGLYAGMAPHERVLVFLTMLGSERTVAFAKDDVAITR